MAGFQTATRRYSDATPIDEWMAGRREQLEAFGRGAAEAGHLAWSAATRSGVAIDAATPKKVIALGAQRLRATNPTPVVRASAQIDRPRHDDMADFQRRQAEFREETRRISRQNRWLAIPALAPAAAVLGLEGGGMWAAHELASHFLPEKKFEFPAPPPRRGGDSSEAQIGMRAHRALKDRVRLKEGWGPESRFDLEDGKYVRPDVTTPREYQMELKPNTATGRIAGRRAVKRYESLTDRKTRTIFYDPKVYQ